MDDSIYIMFPKYEKYYHPYITNVKNKDNYRFCKERRQKELNKLVEQLKEK